MLRYRGRQLGEVPQCGLIGPMEVFDDQQTRLSLARPLEYPGEYPVLPPAAGGAVHRLVETPQLGRLGQIEHIVKETASSRARRSDESAAAIAAHAASASLVTSRPSRLRASARIASRPAPVPKSSTNAA